MPDVDVVVPKRATVDAAEIVGSLRNAGRSFRPFDPRVVDFVADLSQHLRKDPLCRAVPAIAALAFWIRPASVRRLRDEWRRLNEKDEGIRLAPRGVVFHMPPTNVDTLFVYSWIMAALVGNANVIRISSAAGNETSMVLSLIQTVAERHPDVAETMSFVRYGHEEAVTAALSTGDVRVIWGGDDTVRAVRRVPMNPHGVELAFADRFSMAAFDAATVVDLDEAVMAELVRRFFNDAYWFDQLGCSSPRLVFWRGDPSTVADAQSRFRVLLRQRVAAEGYVSPTGAVMNKLVRSAAMAIDGSAISVDWESPEVTLVDQPAAMPFDRDIPGAGMFAFRSISSLADIVPHVRRQDQTLTYYGFERDELEQMVEELNGAGLDRIVPVGEALQFGRFWDGFDLLDAFCRRTAISE